VRTLALALLLVGCTKATPSACPPEMAAIPDDAHTAYCIDRWEDTVTGMLGDRDQSATSQGVRTSARPASKAGVAPTTRVSWSQAVRACTNVGKHLCTVEEWQDACDGQIGPGGRRYPWGDDGDPSVRCASPAGDGTHTEQALSPTGGHPDCVTPTGVYDLLGNGWEWVDPRRTDAAGAPITGKTGGGYYSGRDKSSCDAEPETHHPPTFDGTIVVRCCKEPGP